MSYQPPSRRHAAYATLLGGYLNIGVVTVQGLLLVPLYLRYIGPHLYGAWLGSGDILGWLAVIDMGLASLMIQRMGSAYGRGDRHSLSEYFVTGLATQIVLVTLLISGAAFLSMWIPAWMNVIGNDAELLTGCIILAGVASSLNILNNGVTGFAMALQRTLVMSVASIIGALFGIGVTISLLLLDQGLWAIPLGWVTRDGITLAGNLIYASYLYRSEVCVPLRFRRSILRDFATVSPPMFLSKLGGAFMSRSEVALIAIFIKPELATIYVLTRRTADIVKMVLDRFGGATFAGFAHLLGTGQNDRAADIYQEIMGLFVPTAVFFISMYIVVNKTFMFLWVGNEFYGGNLLTTLIGLSVLVAAGANLINYLYGATGQIARGSLLLLGEGLARLGLMVVLLWWLKLPGLPLATVVTGITASSIILRWTRKELGNIPRFKIPPTTIITYLGLLVVSAFLGTRDWTESWTGLVVLGMSSAVVFGSVAVYISPLLRGYIVGLLQRIT